MAEQPDIPSAMALGETAVASEADTVASGISGLEETQLPAMGAGAPALSAAGTRYTFVTVLGRGGMGVVDRVWDADLMRDLAVKRVRVELRDNPGTIAQFLWEARVGAYLEHPNIVPIHDLGVGKDGPYFTMKRVSGRSLAGWIDELRTAGGTDAGVSLARRLRVAHQVCQAIAFAHRRGVLHRDIKPANVLLGDDGEVLVTDWGLAIPVPGPGGDALRTVMPAGLDLQSAGTPLYMSPEQVAGGSVDERSDVFSLGVTIYETVALERPFSGSSGAELADRVREARHRPLREVSPDAPRSLEAVLERALARAPADRYESASALAEDLEAVLDGGATKAERLSTVRRGLRYYLSHDRAMQKMRMFDIDMWVVAGCLGGTALGLVLAVWLATWTAIAFGACGLALGVPPTVRFLRARSARRTPS